MADAVACDTCAEPIGREGEGWQGWSLRVLAFRGTDRSQPIAFCKANVCRRCAGERTLGEILRIVSPVFEDLLRPRGADGRARAGRERRS